MNGAVSNTEIFYTHSVRRNRVTRGGSEDEISIAGKATLKCKSATFQWELAPPRLECSNIEERGQDIVCNLICNVSMNIHSLQLPLAFYSSHTKPRLAQRESFLLGACSPLRLPSLSLTQSPAGE